MPARSTEPVKSAGKESVLSHIFDAPRKLLWKARTRPEHIPKWFGLRGFTARVARYDFKPFHVTIRFEQQSGKKTRLTPRALFKSADEPATRIKFGALDDAADGGSP